MSCRPDSSEMDVTWKHRDTEAALLRVCVYVCYICRDASARELAATLCSLSSGTGYGIEFAGQSTFPDPGSRIPDPGSGSEL